jgi:predicted Zn-dependent protease
MSAGCGLDGLSGGPPVTASTTVIMLLLISAFVVLCPMASGENRQLPASDRALELIHAGHSEEAVALLNSALKDTPADLKARLLLGEIYVKAGEIGKAEQEFRESVRLHPQSATAAMALGKFYVARSSFAAAEQVLAEAAEQHPAILEFHEQLALTLAAEHKYTDAARHIRLVSAPLDPAARVRYFRLAASIHSGLGERGAAARAMERALSAMPDDTQLRFITALTEADAAEWKACIRNVGPLFQDHPSPETGLLLLRAQLSGGEDFTSTLARLRDFDLADAQRLELRVQSAELLASANQHREAAEELEQALEISKENQAILYNLAVEQYAAGQYEHAIQTVNGLIQRAESAEVDELAGDIEERRGNASLAIHHHQDAVALAANEERYRLSLGATLIEYGDYGGAAEVFQKATALFPNSARSYVGLGMADYLIEKYDDSVSALIRAGELDGSGRVLAYLGATQMDSAAGPSPTAVNFICGRANLHSDNSVANTWCAALLFRRSYLAGNTSAARAAIPGLRNAVRLAPSDPTANCTLGRALAWTEQLRDARRWLEACVRLRPDSSEDRYRLSQVYRSLGMTQSADEQVVLIGKLNAERNEKEAMAQKFAREMSAAPASSNGPSK